MQNTTRKESPCCTCIRVRDPGDCENKLCKDWQAWWIGRWEAMRSRIKKEARGEGILGATISVGGVSYHHPERVRKFLSVNPCVKCTFRGGLCPGTCETRQLWDAAKEKVNELESRSEGQTEEV